VVSILLTQFYVTFQKNLTLYADFVAATTVLKEDFPRMMVNKFISAKIAKGVLTLVPQKMLKNPTRLSLKIFGNQKI
jgi:hypothetical protein